MTKDELFIKSLKNYRKQLAEELAENKRTDGENEECVEYYKLAIQSLDELLPMLRGIDSLYETDDVGELIFSEDEFAFLIECLESYSEVFIVDGRTEEALKRTEEEHSLLADIIFEFYDDDEDDEDYEDEDEESDDGE
ncbi:MAG: hypothetical protein IKO57_08135 [Treponema sp.]|nr:hypothetical protein [Treponema sp.]